MGGEDLMVWPSWLIHLLRTKFFLPCKSHGGGSSRNECNLYCLDCSGSGLCSSCLADHRNHQVIQIRRSSYHDVIRVNEIQKHLDIARVQTYIINGARIVFLNKRPQPSFGKTTSNACFHCNRRLLDAFAYCSLGCKLAETTEGSGENGRRLVSSPTLRQQRRSESHLRRLRKGEEIGYQDETGLVNSSLPTSPPAIVGRKAVKRRKGIPQRAPTGVRWLSQYHNSN